MSDNSIKIEKKESKKERSDRLTKTVREWHATEKKSKEGFVVILFI
jgi:hypothetical protein